MDDSAFQIAYEASRRSMVAQDWQSMDTRDQAALIYQAMRRIDAGNAPVTAQSPDAKPNRGLGAESK